MELTNFIIVGVAWCAAAAVLGFVVGWEKSRRALPMAETMARRPTPPSTTPSSSEVSDAVLAELAVLVWKANKALRGNSARVVERSIEKLLARLKEQGLELNEYKGQRLSVGSRVNVLDKAPGPEDLVLEDLEPEIIKGARLLHQAVIIIGNGSQPAQP